MGNSSFTREEKVDGVRPMSNKHDIAIRTHQPNLKLRVLNVLEGVEEEHLVAFHTFRGEAIGFVTLRKITDSLWGIWNMYVHSDFRGKGIAKLLYNSSFKHLANKGKKAVASVAIDNLASIKSITKTWDGYLSQKFYYIPYRNFESTIVSPLNEYELKYFPLSYARRKMVNRLFFVYENCANDDWLKWLDINRRNFLERFIDYPVRSRGILSMLFDRYILYDEQKGYAVFNVSRVRRTGSVHLFVPRNVSDEDVLKLLVGIIGELKFSRIKAYIMCLAGNEQQIDKSLRKINVKAIQHLVAVKRLSE